MALKPKFEIPSDMLEPHVRYFMMVQLESLAYGMITPSELRSHLDSVHYFISCCGGIHSRLATSNEYYRLKTLDDDKMVEIAKSVYHNEY